MLKRLVGIGLTFFSLMAFGQEAPDVLVQRVTTEVIEIVKQDRAIQEGNTQRIRDLVEAKVLPHFNFTRMTERAVALAWRTATAAQKETLTTEFRSLLVRSYSNTLTQYRNQKIEFKPFKMQAGETTAMVRSEVKQPGAKGINIDYALESGPDGWKVFDVKVDGVSLITNYRGSFAEKVRAAGIDGLIESLRSMNKPVDSPKKS